MKIYRCSLLYFVLMMSSNLLAESPGKVTGSVVGVISVNSQQHTAGVYNPASRLSLEYSELLAELDVAVDYNHKIQKKLALQEGQLLSLQQQLASLPNIEKNIYPLIKRMQGSLEHFIAEDLPFRLKQRQQSLRQLDKDLSSESLSLSQKYHKLLSAYKKEAEYGHQLQTYQGGLSSNSSQVNFLVLGRVAFYYQTLDGRYSAKWSEGSSKWIALSVKFNDEISKAIDMASGASVEQLINFPMLGLK
ncbi:MAG: hypothetical protein OFPII_20460 [Osedax symbiont Rs1]|nr:MAG: hypothetical protein OFPII_20460 [Osedax symbiont Rs1]